jgi:hypothetical protein
MKNFLLILVAICFGACSSTHKIKTSTKISTDSTVSVIKDTTSVKKEEVKSNNFNAKDIDIKINYDHSDTAKKNSDTVAWKPYYYKPTKQGSNNINDIIQDAISNSGNTGELPSSISIHIGSISDSSNQSSKIDSSVSRDSSHAVVKNKSEIKTKDVTRSGLGFGSYVIIGIVVLLVLIVLAFKFKIL